MTTTPDGRRARSAAPELSRLTCVAVVESFRGGPADPRVSANYAVEFPDLIDFLSGLAKDWQGERVHESLEGQPRLLARRAV
jgi:hypothetical protein